MRHRPFSICETKVNSAPTFSASSRWDSPRLSRSSRSQRPALARSSWVDVSDCWWVGAYILSPPIVGAPITDDIRLYTLVARSAGNTENTRIRRSTETAIPGSMEPEVVRSEVGQGEVRQDDAVGAVVDMDVDADLVACRLDRREVGEDRGRDVDDVLVARGMAELGDRVDAKAGVEHEAVVAGVAVHGVVAGTAGDRVIAAAAGQRVIAGAAGQRVGQGIAGAVEVAGADEDQVVDIGAQGVGEGR